MQGTLFVLLASCFTVMTDQYFSPVPPFQSCSLTSVGEVSVWKPQKNEPADTGKM